MNRKEVNAEEVSVLAISPTVQLSSPILIHSPEYTADLGFVFGSFSLLDYLGIFGSLNSNLFLAVYEES